MCKMLVHQIVRSYVVDACLKATQKFDKPRTGPANLDTDEKTVEISILYSMRPTSEHKSMKMQLFSP